MLLGGAVAAGLGAIDDLFDLRARVPAARPGRAGLRRGRARDHASTSSPTRSAAGADPLLRGPIAAGLTIFWIVGMINSINWIDGLDGLSTGVAFIAAVTLGLISLTTQVGGQPLIAVLCFALAGALLGFLRWNFNPASIFTGTSGVQFVGYTLAVLADPRDGQGGRRPARPRRADHRHVLDHRPADLAGSLAVQPGPDAHPPPAARPRADHRQTVLVIYGICLALAVLSLLLSGVTQLYAFLGVFVAFGLILFLPTRGDFDRPDELEAEAYENGKRQITGGD